MIASATIAMLGVFASFSSAKPPPSGALAPTATTSTVSEAVTAPGRYLVMVTLQGRSRATTVTVSLTGQPQRTVHVPARARVHLKYLVVVSNAKLAVHAVAHRGPGVKVTMTLTREGVDESSTPTPPTPVPSQPVATPPAAPTPPAAAPPSTDPYQGDGKPPVFSDEFSGSAGTAPDPSKWSVTGNSGCGGTQLSSDTSSNVYQDGSGHLVLQATHSGNSYTAAQLETTGHFASAYGSVQASIELPPGAGLCSAFWMVGDSSNNCWPGCGEIDILEALGQLPTTAIFTLHGPTTAPSASGNYQQFEVANWAQPDLTAGFHTYGAIWTPTSITWTVDGVAYASENKAQLIAANGPNAWVYDAPFHLILDVAVGNWQEGPDASTPFPAKMLVDWVRWYQ
jgi:beta-glucanase (GH16 family)